VFGAFEFSRANMLVHTTSIAAAEGARRSIVPGATAADCRTASINELAALGINRAEIRVNPTVITDDTSQVTVTVSVPVSGRNSYLIPKFFLGKSVEKSVTLQREGKVATSGDEPVKAIGGGLIYDTGGGILDEQPNALEGS
jgi:hypothetical protein